MNSRTFEHTYATTQPDELDQARPLDGLPQNRQEFISQLELSNDLETASQYVSAPQHDSTYSSSPVERGRVAPLANDGLESIMQNYGTDKERLDAIANIYYYKFYDLFETEETKLEGGRYANLLRDFLGENAIPHILNEHYTYALSRIQSDPRALPFLVKALESSMVEIKGETTPRPAVRLVGVESTDDLIAAESLASETRESPWRKKLAAVSSRAQEAYEGWTNTDTVMLEEEVQTAEQESSDIEDTVMAQFEDEISDLETKTTFSLVRYARGIGIGLAPESPIEMLSEVERKVYEIKLLAALWLLGKPFPRTMRNKYSNIFNDKTTEEDCRNILTPRPPESVVSNNVSDSHQLEAAVDIAQEDGVQPDKVVPSLVQRTDEELRAAAANRLIMKSIHAPAGRVIELDKNNLRIEW